MKSIAFWYYVLPSSFPSVCDDTLSLETYQLSFFSAIKHACSGKTVTLSIFNDFLNVHRKEMLFHNPTILWSQPNTLSMLLQEKSRQSVLVEGQVHWWPNSSPHYTSMHFAVKLQFLSHKRSSLFWDLMQADAWEGFLLPISCTSVTIIIMFASCATGGVWEICGRKEDFLIWVHPRSLSPWTILHLTVDSLVSPAHIIRTARLMKNK